MTSYLDSDQGRRIAYDRVEGAGPGVVFLGGFRSDRGGTKAVALEAWARRERRAFLRFDYSGHGDSSEAFEDGCIGDWAADAVAAIDALTDGPQILVGSSMGGWIATLIARDRPDLVAGLVGVAAAPDFTEDGMAAAFDDDDRARLAAEGRIERTSPYSDAPDVITRRLIEDGRGHLVLRTPLPIAVPVRLLHGTADAEVPWASATRLLEHIEGGDVRATLVRGADHRFSSPECLALIEAALAEVSARTAPAIA